MGLVRFCSLTFSGVCSRSSEELLEKLTIGGKLCHNFNCDVVLNTYIVPNSLQIDDTKSKGIRNFMLLCVEKFKRDSYDELFRSSTSSSSF